MANKGLEKMNTEPWYSGIGNMVHRELVLERSRRTWIKQITLWGLIINGILAIVLIIPNNILLSSRVETALFAFVSLLTYLIALFVPVSLQGMAIDERQTGVASWILSKPVSRKAYIIAKLVGNALAMAIVLVLIQGCAAYVLIVTLAEFISPIGFLLLLGLAVISVLYFTSLTLMLGTLSSNRSTVMTAALGIVLGSQMLVNTIPIIQIVIPTTLTITGLWFLIGYPSPALPLLLLSSIGCIIVFLAIAVQKFNKIEL